MYIFKFTEGPSGYIRWKSFRLSGDKQILGSSICNSLMPNKALYDRLPDHPPAPLEDVIDSAVKTGTDLSQVAAWNYANSRKTLEQKTPIPSILNQRLSIDWADRENRPPPPRASGVAGREAHWLDRLDAGVKVHITEMEKRRDELAAQERPPQALFDHVLADPEVVRLDAGLNQAYAAALHTGMRDGHTSVLERAKYVVEDYLSLFPPDRRREILLGALTSVYSKEKLGSDTIRVAGGA